MICGGLVYGVHECFIYFFTVGAFIVFRDLSLWKVNGNDLYKKQRRNLAWYYQHYYFAIAKYMFRISNLEKMS